VIKIARSFEISCAHHLPLHEGKCRFPHGHNYQIEATLWADELISSGPSTGMVVDFADLDEVVEGLLIDLDHKDLNEVLPEAWQPPTAEHIAQYIYSSLSFVFSNVWSIRVWETRNSYVEVSRG
jgi:6-pyruvoyltetrahydropterin/6-carboxytetrahydropterin synthase